MITALYIGTDRLTLFKDDNIVIKSKVAQIEDITKIFTDTSNTFSVPANDINNNIFKHYYDANVVGGFDARKKQSGVIELSGVLYKLGKVMLNKVIMKSGKPSSYSLDFFGNLVELKDLLSDDKLSDMTEFDAYDFNHTYANVAQRLVTEDTVIMSLFGNRRYLYDSTNTIDVNDTQTNIYYNGTDDNSGVKFNEPKGSIKTLKIIEAIESKYSITFSRDFFRTNEFSNLYMLLSGRLKNSFEEIIPIVNTNDPTRVGNELLAGSETDTLFIKYTANIHSNFDTIPYKLIMKADGVNVYEKSFTGDNFDKVYPVNYSTFNKITFHIEADEPIRYTFSIERVTNTFLLYDTNTPSRIMVSNYSVRNNMPDLKVIDFLKGLFKLYKLIAIVQNDGSVYVDSLTNYYRKGKVYNIDQFVDYKTINISKGKILNEIKYNFEDSTTLLNDLFTENNKDNISYGDLELSIYDANGDLIDGEKLEYKVPFEQIVYERVADSQGVDAVNIQYALLSDESIKAIKPKAHLHYNYNVAMESPIKVISDIGAGVAFFTMNMPMHTLGVDAPVFSTVFGEEFNEYNGNLITETIFKGHHKQYIEGVFSIKRRVYDITVKNLPENIIQSINLNDVLEIKEDYYRIDSMDVNIITGEVKFKLLNAINLDLTPIYSMSLDRVDVTLDSIVITLDNI